MTDELETRWCPNCGWKEPEHPDLALYCECGKLTLSGREVVEFARKAAAAIRERLMRGICPDCDGPIRGTPDRRQAGPSAVVGVWHKFRCACGHASDLIVPDNN